ncbi:MAG: HNH endonuclease [Verrucomicrobiota bacterium]
MVDDPGQFSNEEAFRILILNRVWQPVNIVGVRRAVSLLFQDNAQVIHPNEGNYELLSASDWIERSTTHPPEEGELCVRSVRLRLRLPQILLLKEFDRVPVQDTKLCRRNIFERDNYRCQYCGEVFPESKLNLDHVIPRDRGGRTSWENLVTSCIECNSKKANRLPHQAGLVLRRQPMRPKHRPFLSVLHRSGSRDAWKPFLGKA